MEYVWTFLLFGLGLIMIIKGGDWFLDAIIWIGEGAGISLGIMGATVVSMATTLPEFFVSTVASNEGFTDMAVGNSLGSYICNIAFIIGITTLIRPIKVRDSLFGVKGAMMLGYLSVFYFFASDGVVSHKEGKILIGLVLFFVLMNIFDYKRGSSNIGKSRSKKIRKKDVLIQLLKFSIGTTFVILGAHILVETGVEIANLFRIPKQVISLTLLALGTSLPELVTALSSIRKDKQSISLGNIIGANILNLTIVMGGAALVSDNGLIIAKQTLELDVLVAVFVGIVFILPGILFERIGRLMGVILLITYVLYLVKLF